MATPLLQLPELAAAQSQKHVTVNDALAQIDTLFNLAVTQADLTTPPGSPAELSKYIVAATATGAWAGEENNIALYINAAWVFVEPEEGWRCYDRDTNQLLTYSGSAWVSAVTSSQTLARSDNGAELGFHILEEEITGLTGSTVNGALNVPSNAIIFNVSMRITTTVVGPTNFNISVGGLTPVGAYPNTNFAAGNTAAGATGPTAIYSDTPITIAVNAGANFSAGAIRVAVGYYFMEAPTS